MGLTAIKLSRPWARRYRTGSTTRVSSDWERVLSYHYCRQRPLHFGTRTGAERHWEEAECFNPGCY